MTIFVKSDAAYNMTISIVTAVKNGEQYISDCIDSVLRQTYPKIEHIIVDGGSSDRTVEIASRYKDNIVLVSEKDLGMYDGINKGIRKASGDIIGLLNSDDMLASDTVIENIAAGFSSVATQAIYGNLNYVDPVTLAVQRKWEMKGKGVADFEWGWMPPHPTLYMRKELYTKLGDYSLDFGTVSDYELMLRFFYKNKISITYLPLLFVNMRNGGLSNATIKSRAEGFLNDCKAARYNELPWPLFSTILKKLRKVKQFF